MYAPIGFAANEATATANSAQSQPLVDRSVEDLIAISKAGQSNEAINDAVLGNEAIRESLPNAAEFDADSDSATAEATAAPTVTPRRSSVEGVAVDKLILNDPVVDQAGILTPQEKQRLTAQLRSIYDQGLAQAALVIVPTTNGIPIFDYSLKAAEKWQLGDADTDDGLLIVVAVNDRDLYIQSGYGLEGVLPDAALNRIIRENITPAFKQNDYAGGLSAGISRIQERLTSDPDVLARADAQAAERAQSQNDMEGSPSPIFLFIIAMIFGSVITSIFGRILGSILTAGGFFFGSLALGGGFFMTLIMAIFLWMFLIAKGGGGGGRGGRGGRGGGFIFLPGGGFGGGGGGGFGGGGFGGGGFGGGGGGFGGGGAGGSW
jgi:uncharacterized protein